MARARVDTHTVVEPAGLDPRSPESLASLIKLASHSGQNVGRSARYLLDKITQLQDAGTWPSALPDEPRTWERFCTDVLGYPGEYVEKMREGIAVLDGDPTVDEAVTEAEARRKLVTQADPKTGPKSNSTKLVELSQDDRAKQNGIGRESQRKLDYLAGHAPALLDQVQEGCMSIDRAYKEAKGLPELTPLDYLHRYWRKVDPEDRLRFLVEMLTPNERRALQLGFEDLEDICRNLKG